jgi:uncharacterized membrane protein
VAHLLPARRHEISRLEAFSDAVFAFALTLQVVSLGVTSGRRRRAFEAQLAADTRIGVA